MSVGARTAPGACADRSGTTQRGLAVASLLAAADAALAVGAAVVGTAIV